MEREAGLYEYINLSNSDLYSWNVNREVLKLDTWRKTIIRDGEQVSRSVTCIDIPLNDDDSTHVHTHTPWWRDAEWNLEEECHLRNWKFPKSRQLQRGNTV